MNIFTIWGSEDEGFRFPATDVAKVEKDVRFPRKENFTSSSVSEIFSILVIFTGIDSVRNVGDDSVF